MSDPESGGGTDTSPGDDSAARAYSRLSDAELVEELHDRFDALETALSDRDHRRVVRRVETRTHQATVSDRFNERIRKYTSRDVAEAFVGSIFFAIPLLVEGGVFDVADYFLSFRVGDFPVFFVLNVAFTVGMLWLLIYWTGPQDVAVTRPLFGVVPRRLLGILTVSFVTATLLMTMWGRVDGWQDSTVAVARISAVWTVSSFGAALGDILPGESSGDDINEDIAEFGEDLQAELRDIRDALGDD